jgi:hypothetical protein
MRFVVFLLAVLIACLSAPAWAEKAGLEKKIIKTSFFTIELPERFVHVEGNEGDWIDHIEGLFFANTKDYFPMANKITPDGSCILLEYTNAMKGEHVEEKEFITLYYQNFYEEFNKDNIPNEDINKFEKPRILEKNKLLTTAYSKIYFFDKESKLPMHGYSYATFFKNNNVAILYAYFDSNNEEVGRKAAQEIYEQIKKTSMEINPPKAALQNQFNP